MQKERKQIMDFRYYAIPEKTRMLTVQGDEWIQCFGDGVNEFHFHNHMEIGYCYYGTGDIVFQDRRMPFAGGTITIIPENIPHITKSVSHTISRWEYIYVDVAGIVSDMFPGQDALMNQIISQLNQGICVEKNGKNCELGKLIWKILDVTAKHERFYKETCASLLRLLMFEMIRMNGDTIMAAEADSETVQHISPALNYISKHYSQPIKIQTLADICYMSESHFRRLFGECMNMSPIEYLNLVRVKVACEMIRKSKDSILMIGEKVGFSTPSSLNRNFKRYTGFTPTQWKDTPENYEEQVLNWEMLRSVPARGVS